LQSLALAEEHKLQVEIKELKEMGNGAYYIKGNFLIYSIYPTIGDLSYKTIPLYSVKCYGKITS
jgi:hypothetical protein